MRHSQPADGVQRFPICYYSKGKLVNGEKLRGGKREGVVTFIKDDVAIHKTKFSFLVTDDPWLDDQAYPTTRYTCFTLAKVGTCVTENDLKQSLDFRLDNGSARPFQNRLYGSASLSTSFLSPPQRPHDAYVY